MCDIYDVLNMLFSGYSCSYACWVHRHFQRMLLFSMCWWSQNFRVARASWEGMRSPVLAPLLAATVAAFCRALTNMRMAIHTEDRFWGENTTSCGCQWYKPGKRFIRRSLAIFRKWELTISKQKREWDLSVSSGNHSCQKERCQIDVVTKPNFLEASVVTREGEKGRKRFNGNCICTTSLRIKLRLCILFHLEMDCRVCFCRISEVKLQF